LKSSQCSAPPFIWTSRPAKIWIEYDGTDRPIAEKLVEAGVTKEDIVLAFHPEEVRPYTGYAVK
jgi:hypothetical protein